MKLIRSLLVLSLVLVAPALHAIDDATANKFASRLLTPCQKPFKLTREQVELPLPDLMTASILKVESDDPWCAGGFLEVRTPDRIYIGFPWPLNPQDGPIEKRIETYAWTRMQQQTVKAEVTRKEDAEGMFPVRVWQVTDSGRVPLDGVVDRKGLMFFPGAFFDPTQDPATKRLKMLAPALAKAPARGKLDSKVQVIEFSDFECPSCKRAVEPVERIMKKYGDRIAFHRVDYPLFMNHPWALPAAIMGRAIWKQNHDAFWAYKLAVYDNQDKLNNFVLADFARGFAEDHDLDLKKYDADVSSTEVHDEILAGVGIAMGVQVHATPTFWVNGHPVQIGENGNLLEEAIEAALKSSK